ncbi:MAG: hypothetical protein SGJ17_02920 [Hyphomicrobiales bacterium]|nr:hypothetical protein [Hyphomicrobiales bacterium]
MPAYFSGTINTLRKGVTKMSADAAIKKIESWEDSLESVEISGVKSIIRDLGSLKKALSTDNPDGDRIRHLMAKLADATMSIARKAEERYEDKIMDLGKALEEAAEEDEDDDDNSYRGRSSTQGRSSSSQSSSDNGQGEVRDPEHDGRLKQNRDRGVSMGSSGGGSRSSRDDDSRSGRSSSHDSGQGEVRDPEHDGRLKQNRDRSISTGSSSGGSRSGRDNDEDSRSNRSSSSRDNGQGEVRDPEHDGRLKQNRDRGVSMGSSSGGSRSSRDDYDDNNRSRSRSSRGRDDDNETNQDRDESGRFVRGGHQEGDDGRGEVRDRENDGRLKQNRSSGSSSSSRSSGGSSRRDDSDDESGRERDESGRFVSSDDKGSSSSSRSSGGRSGSQSRNRSDDSYDDDEDVQSGGQGRVKDPEHDRRLSNNR